MLNSRGQSLVQFVLILPIILIVIIQVVDIGKMILLKEEISNINYMTIDYGLDILNKDDLEIELKNVIYKNKSDIDKISVIFEDDIIYITLEESMNFMFLKSDVLSVKSAYMGYLDGNKKVIERVK